MYTTTTAGRRKKGGGTTEANGKEQIKETQNARQNGHVICNWNFLFTSTLRTTFSFFFFLFSFWLTEPKWRLLLWILTGPAGVNWSWPFTKKDIKVNQDHINKKGGSSSKIIKMMGSGYQKKSQDYHSRKIFPLLSLTSIRRRPAVERVDPGDILASKGFASLPSDVVHLSLLLPPFFLMAIDEGIGSYHPT